MNNSNNVGFQIGAAKPAFKKQLIRKILIINIYELSCTEGF